MTTNDATDVQDIKRKARLLAREADIPHRQALDRIARAAGHGHWGSYRSALEAGTSLPGWSRSDGFTVYPPLMQGILSDDDVSCLAVNADGSAWAANGDRRAPAWTRIEPSGIDRQEVLRDFMDTIPIELHNPSGLTFLVARDRSRPHRHDDRLIARRSSKRTGMVEITIAKGPRRDDPRLSAIGDWGTRETTWHAHLFSTRGLDAVRRACDHVIGDRPDTTRLVTFGVKADAGRHPNRVDASGHLYDDHVALDYAIRIGADAYVTIADTPTRAAAAIDLMRAGHAPLAVLVDADPEDVVGRMIDLARAGNVHPVRHVREGLAQAIALLPERCTVHV